MLIEKTLNIIKDLTDEIVTFETMARIKNYLTIKLLLEELRIEGERKKVPLNMFDTYVIALLGHCRVLAGLEAEDGHSEQQHSAWAHEEINKLRSRHCFNV